MMGFVVNEFVMNQKIKEGEMPGVARQLYNTEIKFVKIIEK